MPVRLRHSVDASAGERERGAWTRVKILQPLNPLFRGRGKFNQSPYAGNAPAGVEKVLCCGLLKGLDPTAGPSGGVDDVVEFCGRGREVEERGEVGFDGVGVADVAGCAFDGGGFA